MPTTRSQTIQVEGLTGLLRAFGAADREVRQDLRDALQEAAAPVRSEAQRLAGTRIRNMGGEHRPWARMRIGLYRSVVYIAPVERGVTGLGNRGRRRGHKFATLLLERAMEPALADNRHEVERRLDHMLDEVARVWERHG